MKDIGPIWIDSEDNIDNDPYTSDCIDQTNQESPHAYTQFTITNGEISSKNCIEKPPGNNRFVLRIQINLSVYSTWGEYSACSKTCGGGKKSKERICLAGICSHATPQDLVQTEDCNATSCKLYQGGRCEIKSVITIT